MADDKAKRGFAEFDLMVSDVKTPNPNPAPELIRQPAPDSSRDLNRILSLLRIVRSLPNTRALRLSPVPGRYGVYFRP